MDQLPADETSAILLIDSEVVTAEQIAQALGFKVSKIIFKGTATGRSETPHHPSHIAIFASGLSVEEPLENHLEALLNMCEAVREPLSRLLEVCGISIHCSYRVQSEGGWTLSHSLCQRMASFLFKYLFSVEKQG